MASKWWVKGVHHWTYGEVQVFLWPTLRDAGRRNNTVARALKKLSEDSLEKEGYALRWGHDLDDPEAEGKTVFCLFCSNEVWPSLKEEVRELMQNLLPGCEQDPFKERR